MDGDLIDAGYVTVELFAKKFAGFGVSEEISCEEC
jgi:hypothetical protein